MSSLALPHLPLWGHFCNLLHALASPHFTYLTACTASLYHTTHVTHPHPSPSPACPASHAYSLTLTHHHIDQTCTCSPASHHPSLFPHLHGNSRSFWDTHMDGGSRWQGGTQEQVGRWRSSSLHSWETGTDIHSLLYLICLVHTWWIPSISFCFYTFDIILPERGEKCNVFFMHTLALFLYFLLPYTPFLVCQCHSFYLLLLCQW